MWIDIKSVNSNQSNKTKGGTKTNRIPSSSNCLSGIDNDRLDQVEPLYNEGTAAWANQEKSIDVSLVSVPSENNVESAKRWVDNGSKL